MMKLRPLARLTGLALMLGLLALAGAARAQDLPWETGRFDQDIDHAQPSLGRFAQRYWTYSGFATSADAPVLYHVCGEAPCDTTYFLHDAAIEWARALGARLVYLEHRYYGQSQPFADLSTAHLRYLTVDQTLADLAAFQTELVNGRGWSGRWIVVGGSYAGVLAAMYRLRYPQLTAGALASSAPLKGLRRTPILELDAEDLAFLQRTDLDEDTRAGGRQWLYQACTEMPYWWQSQDVLFLPGEALCRATFGLSGSIDTAAFEARFLRPFAEAKSPASRILFTNGAEDPWDRLGLRKSANRQVRIQRLRQAGHHTDLNAASEEDSRDVVAARALFLRLAREWLAR